MLQLVHSTHDVTREQVARGQFVDTQNVSNKIIEIFILNLSYDIGILPNFIPMLYNNFIDFNTLSLWPTKLCHMEIMRVKAQIKMKMSVKL